MMNLWNNLKGERTQKNNYHSLDFYFYPTDMKSMNVQDSKYAPLECCEEYVEGYKMCRRVYETQFDNEEKRTKFWRKTGLLEKLQGQEEHNMSLLLEDQALRLLNVNQLGNIMRVQGYGEE